MKIRFYSHASYSIECSGQNLIIDPFFSGNPLFETTPFLVKNYLNDIKADYILVTHAHFDHISDVIEIALRTGATVIANYEISIYFKNQGVKNTVGINYGSFQLFKFGKLKYVWAAHSSMFPDGVYGGNPGGFLLSSEGKNIYISGDTGLTQEMKLIPLFTNLHLAIFPIGGVFTMGIDEVIIASNFVKCNRILGVHYDTFDLIKIDQQAAINKFYFNKKKLILLKRNEEIEI